LNYDLGKGPVTVTDKAFPWDFTLPLDASIGGLSFAISGLLPNGKTHTGKPHHLSEH
jgi:hypothetical protein